MGTTAVFTFDYQGCVFHVLKMRDGYPMEALNSIQNATYYAWPMPRFEADDFAAAFVAANKLHYMAPIAKEIAETTDAIAEMPYDLRPSSVRGEWNVSVHAMRGGAVRLLPSAKNWFDVATGDTEFQYTVTVRRILGVAKLWITIRSVEFVCTEFEGTLDDAFEWAKKWDESEAA